MKKSKKFVLAGLALLAAITMVLLPLSSCKTEVDTSSPQQEQTDDSTGNNGSTGTSEGDEDNKPEEHQVDVEATAPVNPSAGTITDSKSDSGYTFTADFGDNASGAYAWFVDGERQECTDKEFTWDTSSVAAGVHEIRVEFGDNDARTTVEVKK
ncbi:MAG: hypothetical protein IKB33_07705 [Spirochaetaceae bacterium]|nr:hypothetical protein [Spirochaetaceae bacterium]